MSTVKKHIIKKVKKNLSSDKLLPDSDNENEFVNPLKTVPELADDDCRILDARKEGDMDSYEETFDDYLEMFIQFGYVVLFSSVYPISALWAVLNNIIEVRADAFKLCKIYQRPMSKRVKNIGAWQVYKFNFYQSFVKLYNRVVG